MIGETEENEALPHDFGEVFARCDPIVALAELDELTAIEQALYQTKNRASEDPLNFPVRLNNKLAALLAAVGSADAQPTASQQQVYEDLATNINSQIKNLRQIMDKDVPAFNKLVREQDIPALSVKAPNRGTL